jgi:hypothetical protein
MVSIQLQDLSSGYFQNCTENQRLIYQFLYKTSLMIYPTITYNLSYFCHENKEKLTWLQVTPTCQTFLSSWETLYRNTAFSVNAQTVPLKGSCVMFTSFPNDCNTTMQQSADCHAISDHQILQLLH